MKKHYKSLLIAAMALLLTTSCEKDLDVFHQDTSWINWFFHYEEDGYLFNEQTTHDYYSFVYEGSGVTADTLWYEVQTTGFVADHDRPIALKQIQVAGANNAVAGIHYVDFDDPVVRRFYVAPAGKPRFKVPIVVLRDASLKTSDVVLKITFQANDDFEVGYSDFSVRTITLSDRLTMPTSWNNSMFTYYFGAYGPVKHRFMIDATGEKWDNDYIDKLIGGDSGYISFVQQSLRKKLSVLNQQRASQGLAPLAEDDGTVVSF